MSIEVILQDCCNEGRLVRLEPLIPAANRPRVVYATPEVASQLSEETADDEFADSYAALRNRLDSFIIGRVVMVGNRTSKTADWKRLDPPSDEVWEMRKREKPGVRVFGRFIMKDVFFASGIRLTSELFLINDWIWKQEIRNCKAAWTRIFHTYQPLHGDTVDDYISNAHRESILNR